MKKNRKERKMDRTAIRTIIAIIIVMIFAFGNMSMAKASTKSDLSLAKNWAKSQYSEPIKVVSQGKVPTNRQGTVYIEKVKTKSDGGRDGHTTKGNYYVKYPKKVKKGKKVTMYFIYNPYTNYCDDIVAVVCLGKVK
jgi:hypothetical protein